MEFIVRIHLTIDAKNPETARQSVIDVLECYPEIMDEIPGLVCSCVDNLEEITQA